MAGFWRKCRIAFRWTRYCFWTLVVLVILGLAWINVVGFPDTVKRHLVAALREQGVTLEFSRMRWHFIHGIVAENVIIGDKESRSAKPLFTAGQVQLRLDYGALLHRRFEISGVVVRDGIFTLPEAPAGRLVLLNMQSEIRFLPDDTWSLDELRADFSGAKIRVAGQIAHAHEMMQWKMFAGQKPGGEGTLSQPLHEFSTTLGRIKFAQLPEINLTLNGDARDVHSFKLQANANVPGVTTPWFSANGLQFAADVTLVTNAPAADPTLGFWSWAAPFKADWTSRATRLEVERFDAGSVKCAGNWSAPRLVVRQLTGHPGGGEIDATAALDVATRAFDFTNSAVFDPHVLKPFLPAKGRDLLADALWTRPPSLTLKGHAVVPSWTNADWSVQDFLLGPQAWLEGETASTNAVLRGQTVELAQARFSYTSLIWNVPELRFNQGRTRLEFSGAVSTATENFNSAWRGTLTEGTVRSFLPTNTGQAFFQLVKLEEPVYFNLTAAGNLKNLAAVGAAGHLAMTNFTIREQGYDSVATELACSNRVLTLTHGQVLRAQGTQVLTADAVVLDWNQGLYFFTNGYSTVEPMAVLRAIGPVTAHILEPYQFLAPPEVRVNGQLPLRDINSGHDLDGTDMTFDIIRGVPFTWEELRTTNVMGTIRWMGQELWLKNLVGTYCRGDATGEAYFDFRPVGYDCDFKFDITVTNVDVYQMGLDLATNKSSLIEGRLDGHVAITNANSKTWQSWNGYGDLRLRDGLLWNVPIFSFASRVMNSLSPGLGNSRATAASVQFVMTNGVARSDLLLIQTLMMRLQYSGTVDLEENANARVTAQLMRNTPVLGPLLSAVLWPVSKVFECQVTGQISDPTVTPIFFPFSKYLLKPLRSTHPAGDTPADKPKQ